MMAFLPKVKEEGPAERKAAGGEKLHGKRTAAVCTEQPDWLEIWRHAMASVLTRGGCPRKADQVVVGGGSRLVGYWLHGQNNFLSVW